MAIIEGHERELGRQAAIDVLQRRIPDVFGQQARPNTMKDLLVTNANSLFYQSLALDKRPLIFRDNVLDIRAESTQALNDIYIHLSRLRDEGNFDLNFGLKVHGAYNFGLSYTGFSRDSVSSHFRAHWINNTPALIVNPASRMVKFEITDNPVRPISFDELGTVEATALIEHAQRHNHFVKIDKVEVDKDQGLVAVQYRLTDKTAIWGAKAAHDVKEDTFEIIMPLQVKVDLQGQDFVE